MKTILLTLDYELYGNGSGDVFRHIIEPTNKILAVCLKYHVKLTIFFEVIEYLALKREWDSGNTMGYAENPISAMEHQIQEAYRHGHDVQLHIHPQWINAVYNDGQWKVDLDNWRLGEYHGEGEKSLYHILRQGKDTVEQIIRPVDTSYQCTALRAGWFNIQPSHHIVHTMQELGMKMDSSVFPGGKETGTLNRFDFTSITNDKGYWHVDRDVTLESLHKTNVIELPIVAYPMKRYEKFLTISRLKNYFKNTRSSLDSLESKISHKTWLSKISYFFDNEWQTWDFCLFSKKMHKKFMEKCNRVHDETGRKFFVAIGHPKGLTGIEPLTFLIEYAGMNGYRFGTFSDVDQDGLFRDT